MPLNPNAILNFLANIPPEPVVFKGKAEDWLFDWVRRVGGVDPIFKTKPRKVQVEGLAFTISSPCALLFYEMRTGKTHIALNWLTYLKTTKRISKALIIVHAPIGVDEWESQIPLHSDLDITPIRSSASAADEFLTAAQSDADIVIAWSTLQAIFTHKVAEIDKNGKEVSKLKPNIPLLQAASECFDAVVIDEIHKAGHKNSLRFRMAEILVSKCQWRLGLTGTPFGRNPFLLWAQLYLIDSGASLGRSYWFFEQAFGKKKYNHFTKTKYEYTFNDELMPILQAKIKPITLSCKLTEVQDVNVLNGIVKLRMSKEQCAAYLDAANQLIRLHQGQKVEIQNAFIRLRQISSGFLPFTDRNGEARIVYFDNPKLDWLEEFLAELNYKAVLFHDFIPTGQKICDLLAKCKIKHGWLHGGTKNRPSLLKEFQEGKMQILVANSATGGTGTNFSAADYVGFLESPVPVIDRKQAEFRALARGDRVLAMDDIICSPVEEKILGFIREGKSLLDALLADKDTVKNLLDV